MLNANSDDTIHLIPIVVMIGGLVTPNPRFSARDLRNLLLVVAGRSYSRPGREQGMRTNHGAS